MTVIHTAARQRITPDSRPPGCPVQSAGMFVIRSDGTATFDRHYHDFDEFWLVAAGTGTVQVGDEQHHITAGDIIFTAAGLDHDVIAVAEELRVFWLSLPPAPGGSGAHLHRTEHDAIKHAVRVVAAGGRR
ncbi:AraC family ligand binding domain-containing protein [Solwaraspora sp. WMMD792]|uniref:cupin domain-containing protein n=1 Tax=Solwaraspora sp. WMMD792 TaxID=3016099 RepID=UPI00241807DA|nr:AraC family ligand binding domain-containing protein [Solwaraspora sp. WMMD792]MDG4773536.1 AraC family ligand binding domain-containing protein [Solwaraspora sp. WMMD792]